MSGVISKCRVTVPRSIAQRFDIRPGDSIEWVAAGETIRVIPAVKRKVRDARESRLRLFDRVTERQAGRAEQQVADQPTDRGWRREDLCERSRSRLMEA